MAIKIGRAVRRANEDRYADSDDFPVRFANLIRWVPTGILMLLAINFYADNVWVKFARDLFFIGANIWFCILTLNPWRKLVDNSEKSNSSENYEHSQESLKHSDNQEVVHSPVLSDFRYDDLARRLDKLLSEEHIFSEPHITIDTLILRLGTNTKYLSEVIHRSGYQSFCDMICQHRVRHAIELIHQHPGDRLAYIANQCGFSSPASMAKAFKAQGKEPPSTYRS